MIRTVQESSFSSFFVFLLFFTNIVHGAKVERVSVLEISDRVSEKEGESQQQRVFYIMHWLNTFQSTCRSTRERDGELGTVRDQKTV